MRQLKFVVWILSVLFALVVSSTAWAQIKFGPVEVTGFYQLTLEPSLEHDKNPNNEGLLNREGAPHFLLARQLIDLNFRIKFTDELIATFEPRFFHDFTSDIDSHFRNYNAFPAGFAGDGNLLQASSNKFKAELWQAYIDYRRDPCGFAWASNKLPGERRLPYVF